MTAQLENEIKAVRKRITLIMLILPYSLFIGFGLIFKNAFVALILGMTVTFAFFIITTAASFSKLKTKYKDLITNDTEILIEKSYNVKNTITYLLFHVFIIGLMSCITNFDVLSVFAAVFSLIFIGLPLLILNSAVNNEIFKTPIMKLHQFDDNYVFTEHCKDSRMDVDNIWYSDHCLPGNPIFLINK